MKKQLLLLTLALVGTLLFTQCNKKPDAKTPAQKKTAEVDARAFDQWAYFNLREGKVVTVTNPETDLTWDIAFHRYDFRTNSGASGKGQGGAAETAFAEVTDRGSLPEASAFTQDEIGTIVSYMSGGHGDDNGIQYAQTGVNYLLTTKTDENGKIVHQGAIAMKGMPPTYEYSGKVYAVRCADGSHALVKVTNYKNAHNESAFINFEYSHLSDN